MKCKIKAKKMQNQKHHSTSCQNILWVFRLSIVFQYDRNSYWLTSSQELIHFTMTQTCVKTSLNT